jgi:cyclopropane fatty-acyl-phospholipid synthase-like methyltransferase
MSDLRSSSGLQSESDPWTYARQRNQSALTAAEIERGFAHSVRFYRALLGEHLPRDRDAIVLDLPCGEGMMIYAMREMGYRNVSGYDIDRNRLATGQKLGLPLHQGDVFEVLETRSDGSVGCVLAMDFLEHVEKPQVIEFLSLVHRKLAHGGLFLARTPCASSPQGATHVFNDFTHKWGATAEVLRWLLEAAGFAGVQVIGEHPQWAMSWGWLRVPLFTVSTAVANGCLRLLGLSPYSIWSGSMWGIARRP